MYLGSFAIDDTCTLYANAHTPATGAAVDADAVPGYRAYEDETGTPILTGSYALLDDTNTVGFYSEQITLSAANGFEAGKSYSVRTTIVVGGVTGVQIDRLQIGAKVDARMIEGVDATTQIETSTATAILATPANKIVSDASGGVRLTNLTKKLITAGAVRDPSTTTQVKLAATASASPGAYEGYDLVLYVLATTGPLDVRRIIAYDEIDQVATLDKALDFTPVAATHAYEVLGANGREDLSIQATLASGVVLTAAGVDAIHDEVVEGTTTHRQSMRLANSANAGKLSGAAANHPLIRDLADTKNRIDATTDADGNRLTVTLDVT